MIKLLICVISKILVFLMLLNNIALANNYLIDEGGEIFSHERRTNTASDIYTKDTKDTKDTKIKQQKKLGIIITGRVGKNYIDFIEDFIGATISSISTSPEREDTILIENPFEI